MTELSQIVPQLEEEKSGIFRNLIKLALTNLGAKVAIYQNDGVLLWSNEAYKKTSESEREGSGRICLDHLHNERGCPGYLLKKTAEQEAIQHSTFMIENDVNERTYYNSFTFPVYDHDSQFSNIIEICWKISKSEALERLTCGANALLDNLAGTSLHAILIVDANNMISFWNTGAEKLFGYTFDEVLHTHYNFLSNDSDQTEQILNLMNKFLKIRVYIKNFETELKTKDGNLIRVEITGAFMHPERKEQYGTYWIIKDIGVRKSLEYRYQRTIEKLQKLHEIAYLLHQPVYEEEIYQAMLVSVTAGEGLRFNRAYLLMADYDNNVLEGKLAIGPASPEEAGKIWGQLPQQFTSLSGILESFKHRDLSIHEPIMDVVRSMSTPLNDNSSILVKALKERRSFLVKNGSCAVAFDVSICTQINNDTFSVIPINAQSGAIGVLLVDNVYNKKEITEEDIEALEIFATQAGFSLENARLQKNVSLRLKELEEAYGTLQDSQNKLVKSERLATIGEVVAKVSHEIRNPLVNIGGFANQLLRKTDPASEDFQYLKIIADETRRLENILGDILNYSSEYQPKKELVNLGVLLDKNLLILMDEIHQHAIGLNLNFEDADCILYVDPNQITQVFLNIMRNCIQAMPKGGKMSVSFSRNNGFAVVTIKDTGVGIRKKDMGYLFQRFYTTKSNGLGLGLPISQQIMKVHGGSIEVRSKYRKGTAFEIYLPTT